MMDQLRFTGPTARITAMVHAAAVDDALGYPRSYEDQGARHSGRGRHASLDGETLHFMEAVPDDSPNPNDWVYEILPAAELVHGIDAVVVLNNVKYTVTIDMQTNREAKR